MLEDILRRIDERLQTLGLSESKAAKLAGLSDSAIRDMRRAVKAGRTEAGVSTRTLVALAPVLQTTSEWLLTGRSGDTRDEVIVPIMGYVGAGAEVEPEFEQVPPDGLDQVHLPIAVPDDMIAFRVRGDSMLPAFKDGAVIVVYREQQKPLTSFFGEEAAVRTADGRRFIKTIMRGQNGLVNLLSWNSNPIENVALEWIGEIFAILPPAALRKAQRQGGIQGQLPLRA